MPSNIFKTIEAEQTVFILFSVLPGVCWLIFWVLTNGFDVISASSDLHSSEDTEFEETSILKRYSHENRGCRPLNKLHSIPISWVLFLPLKTKEFHVQERSLWQTWSHGALLCGVVTLYKQLCLHLLTYMHQICTKLASVCILHHSR